MTHRFYQLLLKAHPVPMRAEYAREMELAFVALCNEQRGSIRGLAAVIFRETVDVVRSGLRERRGSGSFTPPNPPKAPWIVTFWEGLVSDLRLAFRGLRGQPAFSAVAVTTLALGIGATTAVFSLVDATLLRPLDGVAEPDRLAVVYEFTRGRYGTVSYPDYRDLRTSAAFSGLAATTVQGVVLQRDGGSERLSGQFVSASYFGVLGVRPALGRGFRPEEEDGYGAQAVVVLGHDLWRRLFSANPAAVGRTIVLNGRSFEIVGVAPEGFRGTTLESSPDLWLPMVMIGAFVDIPLGPEILDFRGLMMFSIIGRRAAGVTLEAAQAAVDLEAREIEAAAPGMFDQPRQFLLVPAVQGAFQPAERDSVVRYTGVLFAVAGALLVIAAINIAALISVRAIGRRHEIGVRLALGASRPRIARQLAVEGLVIALIGGLGAVFVARWSMPLLESLQLPGGLSPRLQLDSGMLGFNMLLATFTGVIFGLLPAMGVSSGELNANLASAAPRPAGRGGGSSRSMFVVFQIAVSVVLLVGAGLLARSVWNLAAVEHGFDANGVLLATFDLDQAGYEEDDGRVFFRDLVDRLETVDGIGAVSIGTDVPLGGPAGALGLFIEGGERVPGVGHSLVGPGYFSTLSVPLVSGREFTAADREGAPGVVVANEALADLVWPGEDAVGQSVRFEPGGEPFFVVGVVRNYRHTSLREDARPRLYWSIEQQYQFDKGAGTRTLLARTGGPPLAMLAAARTVVHDLDPDLPLFGVTTLRERMRATFAEERQSAVMLGAFSALALLLSSLGLFGVLAYDVSERRREIGVRCALGATSGNVAAFVVRQGVGLAMIGVVAGLMVSAAATRVLSAWLFEVEAIDLPTFGFIAVLVVLVTACASYLPARRASRVDPAIALRGQ